MPQTNPSSHRILLLGDSDRESRCAGDKLTQHGHEVLMCRDLLQLATELRLGAGACIVFKTCFDLSSDSLVAAALAAQPSWSHLPIIVLIPEGEGVPEESKEFTRFEQGAHLTFLEWPAKSGLLVRAARAALSYRARQYKMRDLMAELERSRHDAVEASRAKSDFLANMSHEIRTPLGAILGFTELMMDSGISKHEKKDYMMAARRNGQLLSALIDDILDLSRVEAGRLEIAKLEFSLNELVSEVISALEPLASKKGLPLVVDKPKDLDQLTGDPIRLKQILVNIVGNAIKFTSHGAVDVRFRLDVSGDRPLLNIEVEDTGIGISSQQAAQLFRPFTQADTSSTRKFGGTGLGLVLSQRLARAMGGDLKLQWSIPGGGSSFAVSLPVLAARKRRPLKKALSQEGQLPLAGSRILLVDDSLDNQMLISRILKLLGAEVDLANDGIEGVEKAMNDSHDVVLMDLQMPRLGGVEATRVLRAKGYLRPIVALTAHSMKEDRQRCISVGCTDYLTKPVQRSHLVQVIERVAQLRSTGDAARPNH